MSGVGNKVFEEALSLPSDERVSLVEKLLTSLNLPIQEEIDQWWAEEAERRVSQIEQGEVELIAGNRLSHQKLRTTGVSPWVKAFL